MKFSVLIPTRNRLTYLKYAIQSVLDQSYRDWEIIISDNASEENIEEYISSLKDERIKYFRTSSFCSVTENWNNALDRSTGDYVIMIGDDDCLLDGYFSHSLLFLEEYGFPQMLYSSAFIYTYPGVLPHAPAGSLMQLGYAPFLLQKQKPYILDKNETEKLVHKILNFNVSVNFNMQHSLVSRKLIQEMQKYGLFYQSPYPDYYATTALLLKAKQILAVPFPMVVIGVCPKSFGCFYSNNKESQGNEFLHPTQQYSTNKKISKYILAGTDMNIFWLMAMQAIFENFGKEYPLKVRYTKFRFLQMLHMSRKFATHENVKFKDMIYYIKNLFPWEIIPYFCFFCISLFIRLRPHDIKRRSWAIGMAYRYSHPNYGVPKSPPKTYANILEVFKDLKIE